MSMRLGIIFFVFGFIIFCNLEAGGADWRHYGTMENLDQFFYDKDGLTHLPEGVVRVWGRVIKDEDLKKAFEEKTETTKKFIEGKVAGKKALSKEETDILYEQWQKEFLEGLIIAEKRMLIELKCGENRYRLISGIEYDEKGNLKKAFSASQAEWLPIRPETPIGGLYNTMCPKPK
jgi:hypothetical protein